MTIDSGFLTVVDLVRQSGDEALTGMVDETTKARPEISGMTRLGKDWIKIPGLGAAVDIPGFTYPTLVTTALPTVDFVDLNDGTDRTKGSQELRESRVFDLNPRWSVGVRLADKHPKGMAYLMTRQAEMHLKASWDRVASTFYYGTHATYGSAKGFPGLLQGYDATNMVIDAAGTSAAGCSSVWLVAFELECVHWVYGNDGKFRVSDIDIREVDGNNGKKMSAYCQELFAYVGLKFVSQTHVVRIKNISAQTGKNLTDNMVADALALFPTGVFPTAAFMTRRTLSGLQKSRTNVSGGGSKEAVPVPTSTQQVPIAATDALLNTEPPTL